MNVNIRCNDCIEPHGQFRIWGCPKTCERGTFLFIAFQFL